MLMMHPAPHLRSAGKAARAMRNGADRFTAMVRSQVSSLIFSAHSSMPTPALFTSTSIWPNSLTTAATTRSGSLGTLMSATMEKWPLPGS
jgi:hypothetical protein